ncbi:hypothetical protein KI387_022503, partial [Taxus chinensis]
CNPDNNIWERLPPMTKFQEGIILPVADCDTVNGKLVLIGTVNDPHISKRMKTDHNEKIRRVFLYDFSKSQWRRCKDMPVICSNGVSAAIAACTETGTERGFIYVAGGYNIVHGPKFLGAAAIYRVEEDEWEILPNMNRDIKGEGAFIDGKFYVIDESRSAEVFHPDTRRWTTEKNRGNPDQIVGPCMVPVGKRLYCYGFFTGFMEYMSKECVWKELGPCPMKDVYDLSSATQWGDNIIFGGSDLRGRAVFRIFLPPATEGAQFSETDIESRKDFTSW